MGDRAAHQLYLVETVVGGYCCLATAFRSDSVLL
jgi:hypothetical protein